MPGAKPPDPDALMNVTSQNYLDWVDRQHVFESMAAVDGLGAVTLRQPPTGEPEHRERRSASRPASSLTCCARGPCSAALFTVGQRCRPDSDRVAVLSDGLWQPALRR